MSKVSVKGTFLGGVADIVATNIFAIPLILYVVRAAGLAHTAKGELQAAVAAAIQGNPSLFGVQILIGVGCSVLGGYIAARQAKHDELLNGALSSWLCVGLGVYAIATGKAIGSPLMQLADFIAAPASGLIGGYLRVVQVRASARVVQQRAPAER